MKEHIADTIKGGINDMGEMADYYTDIENYGENPNDPSHDDEGFWTTSDGTTLAIKDMTTRHITNSIRMIQREKILTEKLKELQDELKNREEK